MVGKILKATHLFNLVGLALVLAVGSGCGESGTDTPGDNIVPPTKTVKLAFDRIELDGDANGPAFVTIGDLNGDGKSDLIVSKFGQVDMATFTIPNGEVTAYLQGNSLVDWTTVEIVTQEDGIIWPNDVTLYDIDGDNDLDAVVPGGFLFGMINGNEMTFLILQTQLQRFKPGAVLNLGTDEASGTLLYMKIGVDMEPQFRGFIPKGTWTIGEAGTFGGAPVTGSVSGEVMTWGE